MRSPVGDRHSPTAGPADLVDSSTGPDRSITGRGPGRHREPVAPPIPEKCRRHAILKATGNRQPAAEIHGRNDGRASGLSSQCRGFASEAWFHTYTPARFVPGADPEKFHLRRQLMAIHWPYDRHGRMIGEHIYGHDSATQTHEIPAHEYITFDEAREKLLPLLRPLPRLQVV